MAISASSLSAKTLFLPSFVKPTFKPSSVSYCGVNPRTFRGLTVKAATATVVAFKEASINLKLPRRRFSVQFTCNICGERTPRLINRLAYEKGTVYVKCAGCSQYHKLVDNLNLVVEYDFREDVNVDPDADQI